MRWIVVVDQSSREHVFPILNAMGPYDDLKTANEMCSRLNGLSEEELFEVSWAMVCPLHESGIVGPMVKVLIDNDRAKSSNLST